MKRCEFEATGSRFCECPKCWAAVAGKRAESDTVASQTVADAYARGWNAAINAACVAVAGKRSTHSGWVRDVARVDDTIAAIRELKP